MCASVRSEQNSHLRKMMIAQDVCSQGTATPKQRPQRLNAPHPQHKRTGVFAKHVSPPPHCAGAPLGQGRAHAATAAVHDVPQKLPPARTAGADAARAAADARAARREGRGIIVGLWKALGEEIMGWRGRARDQPFI